MNKNKSQDSYEKIFEELEKINSSLSQFSIDIQQKALQYYKIHN